MGKKPFTTVYLTGTVRDTKHRRMSKSLGNGIDPLDVVRLFGADALRWTLIAGGSLGADVILDPDDLETTFAPGRNFANKLWNIARFILAQLPADVPRLADVDPRRLTLADRWILSRAQSADRRGDRRAGAVPSRRGGQTLLRVRLGRAGRLVRGNGEAATRGRRPGRGPGRAGPLLADGARPAASGRAVHYRGAVAEAPGAARRASCSSWRRGPRPIRSGRAPRPTRSSARVRQAITAIRNIRAEYRVPPKARLAAAIRPAGGAARATLEAEHETILRLAQLRDVDHRRRSARGRARRAGGRQ